MLPITTKFTKLMNIRSPIVAAPMYYASTPDLAAKVTAAGGFGFTAAGFSSSEDLKRDIQAVRSALGLPVGVPVPVGTGFLGWILDTTETSDDPVIPSYLDELPTAIWFAFGTNLAKYIAYVRAHDAKREHKTIVFVIVNSVAEALHAANEWKVDVLVVQGNEAGGHGRTDSPPLLYLLQAVLHAIPNGPLIVAAGGISTGAQIASLLTMGASGVVLGTRFLFTPECSYSDAMKAVLVDAGANSTARSYAYDEVNPTPTKVAWPAGVDARGISNSVLADYKRGLSLEERIERVETAKAKGDKDYLLIWAGGSVGLVKEIKGTTDVMHELHNETVAALKLASLLVG